MNTSANRSLGEPSNSASSESSPPLGLVVDLQEQLLDGVVVRREELVRQLLHDVVSSLFLRVGILGPCSRGIVPLGGNALGTHQADVVEDARVLIKISQRNVNVFVRSKERIHQTAVCAASAAAASRASRGDRSPLDSVQQTIEEEQPRSEKKGKGQQ